jgi:hypothetical protein
MLLIRTKSGTEIRVPVSDLESITEIEPSSGTERPVAPHPYLHREGVNRCAACWRDRLHPAHTDTAVH